MGQRTLGSLPHDHPHLVDLSWLDRIALHHCTWRWHCRIVISLAASVLVAFIANLAGFETFPFRVLERFSL